MSQRNFNRLSTKIDVIHLHKSHSKHITRYINVNVETLF